MHFIQKHILDSLRTAVEMRYTQLNTDHIESGHFRYHLSELVKDGYVDSPQRGVYRLTNKGKSLVDKLSGKGVNLTPMPKVITYTLLKDKNSVLLLKKPKEPYMGLFNMIGGKLHEGELAAEASQREVKEKTGVNIGSPELRGIFEVLISLNSELLTHVIAYVFAAEATASDFKDDAILAIPIEDLVVIPNLAPDFMPIFQKIHNNQSVQTGSLNLQM